MAEQGTEKPTEQRVKRARKEGSFPSSREFVSAVHFTGFVALAVAFSAAWLMRTARVMHVLLQRAFSEEITSAGLVSLIRKIIIPEFVPLLLAGGALLALSLSAQLAITGLGISLAKLTPDFNRLNFLKRISNLPGQNLPLFFQALLLLPVIGLAVYYEATENMDSILSLPWMAPQVAISRIGGMIGNLLWRAAGLFLIVGVGDLIWQRHRYTKQLRMTKQEIQQETKDAQGSPHVKMRIRRLQRDLARRTMMKEVPKATAVIVNPTHYAVAIRYSLDSAGAPKVVAKGKNYVAARIRAKAIEHRVPIVENPPLAQALYKSVEVGQEIPAHLYRAVAEILAYIYRLMNGHLPG